MQRIPVVVWATAILWALALDTGATSQSHAQSGSRLADLIERLELTPAGAADWLERLRVSLGSRGQRERLLLVSAAGETILEVEGEVGRVDVTPEISVQLSRETADIVLIHNHPASRGLSGGDLMVLSKRRATAIAAMGHDGSVYVAARGPRFGGARFYADQYLTACAVVEQKLSFYFTGAPPVPWRVFFAHIIATALSEARVIEYRAFLSAAGLRQYGPIASAGDRAAEAAAQLLADGKTALPRHDRDSPCRPDSSALSHVRANVQSRVTV